MNPQHFKTELLRPALQQTYLWSRAGENLMLGTALAESNLERVRQTGGKALSFFQIEPATYIDILKYLNRRQTLRKNIFGACGFRQIPDFINLTWDIRLSILVARIIYWRQKEPLPKPNDFVGLANYWKKYYNTEQGKGTVEHWLENWNAYNDSRTRKAKNETE